MNIVFDLGGVVFNWQPDAIIRHVFRNPETQDLVRAEIFQHADWVELDRGTIALDEAINQGVSRTGLPREDIARLFSEVPRFLTPIHATIELIRSIRNSPNKIFVLSNMHLASIAYLEQKHKIWDLFDGIVISSRIQMVKPELEIYRHLLTEHGLEATETVFIDDMSENLAAASSIGIHTIRFVSPSQCRRELADIRRVLEDRDPDDLAE